MYIYGAGCLSVVFLWIFMILQLYSSVLFCSLRVSMWTLISSSGNFKFLLHNCIQTILFATFSISVAGRYALIIVKCKQVYISLLIPVFCNSWNDSYKQINKDWHSFYILVELLIPFNKSLLTEMYLFHIVFLYFYKLNILQPKTLSLQICVTCLVSNIEMKRLL